MIKIKNNSIKMKEIRKKIDSVDSRILPLMVKRSELVCKALELKTKKSEIIDVKRINQIKKKVVLQSRKLGGNPKLMSKIWISMIQNFIDFERRNFKK